MNARLVAGSVTDMVINLYRAVGAFDGVNGGSVAGGLFRHIRPLDGRRSTNLDTL